MSEKIKKILVTGANGQLGSELKVIAGNNKNFEFIFTDYQELDISNKPAVVSFVKKHKPNYIINCAAYTAVDKAESEKEKAFLINAESVKNLTEASVEINANFISISTDYVYSGNNFKPYKETDKTAPESVYGETKLAGENEALKYNNSLIIRTSWLYSRFGNNFVKTMLKLGRGHNSLNIIFDQIGTPTYAADLAKAIIEIVTFSEKNGFKPGIYNYSNEGVTSWFDFAHFIFKYKNIDCKISAIETTEYPTPAKRPHYSVMNKAKIKSTFNISIPHWHDSLIECLKFLD